MDGSFKMKRGTAAQFAVAEWVPDIGYPLLNLTDWSIYIGDGVSRVCDLKPCGTLPESVRGLYE